MIKSKKYKLAALVGCGLFSLSANAEVTFSHVPVIGYAKLPPNVLLMLSVEFPTAKGAHQSYNYNFTSSDISNITRNVYLGYFDSNLCYTYVHESGNLTTENGYFRPTSKANSQYMCSGTQNEWSGNLLNAMTMSAIDVFRLSLSGGNRAKGYGTSAADYSAGDTETETYLRRTNIYGSNNEFLNNKKINGTAAQIRRVTPFSVPELTFNNGTPAGMHKFGVKVTGTGVNQGYNVVVQSCIANANLREAHCIKYSNGHYKPGGLLQEYSKQMRFGVFGYLNNHTVNDGGVMRARLKLLAQETRVPSKRTSTQYTLGKEIDENTGQFIINPDTQDATNSSVSNSGVINYLNKFGDASGFKTYDPIGRLYYSGLRYLKGLPNPTVYTQYDTVATRDNFPVIKDWDDPLKRDADQGCTRSNVMIIIGDTNAHDASGINRVYSYSASGFTDDNTNYSQLAAQVLTKEGAGGNEESNGIPIVGQAYAAHTRDLRLDLPGMQTAKTIGIDVVEYGNYKSTKNAYYLASKYGGFDKNSDTQLWPEHRSDWTDDSAGNTTIPQFPQGTPRNFAVARDASAMDAALKSAFNTANKSPITQASVSTPVSSDAQIPPNKPNERIYSEYYSRNWYGDVVVADNKKILWRVSNALNSQLSPANAWASRKVFYNDASNLPKLITDSDTALQSALAGKDNKGMDRIRYILGNRALEGGLRDRNKPFRIRAANSILGTIIHSPIAYLPNPEKEIKTLSGCNYANPTAAVARKYSMAFAANDGMLHIINSQQKKEIMSFIPRTAFLPSASDNTVSKLVRYTQKDYEHEFINDGIPVTREMCFPNDSNKIKSILVGTAGRGGRSVYAIDGTDLSSPSSANILWEFTDQNDSDLGVIISAPVLAYDATKRPIAIVSGGYNAATLKSNIFVFRLDQSSGWSLNNNYYKIEISGSSSGLGAIEVVDTDGNGIPEKIYVGDMEGRLWKIDTTDTDIKNWKNAYTGPMYTALDVNNAPQPITAAPTFAHVNGKNYIYFGTGVLFNANDTKRTGMSVYGLIDNAAPIASSALLVKQTANVGGTAGGTSGGDADKMNSVGVIKNEDGLSTGAAIYHTTQNQISNTDEGWRFDLPDNFMVINKSIYYSKNNGLFVPIFKPTETSETVSVDSSCSITGKSGFLSLLAANGAMSNTALIDTDGNNKVNANDIPGGMVLINSQNSGLSLMQTENGPMIVLPEPGPNGSPTIGIVVGGGAKTVRRLSWRIIS